MIFIQSNVVFIYKTFFECLIRRINQSNFNRLQHNIYFYQTETFFFSTFYKINQKKNTNELSELLSEIVQIIVA